MMMAFVMIKIAPIRPPHLNWLKTVKEKVEAIKEVDEVHSIFGRYDIIAKVVTGEIDEISKIVDERIRLIPGVASTETFIVMGAS